MQERYDFDLNSVYKKNKYMSLKSGTLNLAWDLLMDIIILLKIENSIDIDALYIQSFHVLNPFMKCFQKTCLTTKSGLTFSKQMQQIILIIKKNSWICVIHTN